MHLNIGADAGQDRCLQSKVSFPSCKIVGTPFLCSMNCMQCGVVDRHWTRSCRLFSAQLWILLCDIGKVTLHLDAFVSLLGLCLSVQ